MYIFTFMLHVVYKFNQHKAWIPEAVKMAEFTGNQESTTDELNKIENCFILYLKSFYILPVPFQSAVKRVINDIGNENVICLN